jgi:hypothetical protein
MKLNIFRNPFIHKHIKRLEQDLDLSYWQGYNNGYMDGYGDAEAHLTELSLNEDGDPMSMNEDKIGGTQ